MMIKKFLTFIFLTCLSTQAHAQGEIYAPFPGKVQRIYVTPGQYVQQGDQLIELEVMKMNVLIRADISGYIAELPVNVGQILEDQLFLARLSPNKPVQEQVKAMMDVEICDILVEAPKPVLIQAFKEIEEIVQNIDTPQPDNIDLHDDLDLLIANNDLPGPPPATPEVRVPMIVGIFPPLMGLARTWAAFQPDIEIPVLGNLIPIIKFNALKVLSATSLPARYLPLLAPTLSNISLVFPERSVAYAHTKFPAPLDFHAYKLTSSGYEPIMSADPFNYDLLHGIILWMLLSLCFQGLLDRYKERRRVGYQVSSTPLYVHRRV